MPRRVSPRGSSFDDYVRERLRTDPDYAEIHGKGYEAFKAGMMLKMARKDAKMTQGQVAEILGTNKSHISRIENKNNDIRVSTFFKYIKAVGKELRIADPPETA